jgi:hypothetical protein
MSRSPEFIAFLEEMEANGKLFVTGWIDGYDAIHALPANDQLYHPEEGKYRGWRYSVRGQEMYFCRDNNLTAEETMRIEEWLEDNGYVFKWPEEE